MSSAKTTEEELTPDGYESLFDGRETERVANLIIGAPGPDTLKRKELPSMTSTSFSGAFTTLPILDYVTV